MKPYLPALIALALSTAFTFDAQADYLNGGTDFQYVSSDAILNTSEAYAPWNTLDKFGDGSTSNTSGVVFRLDQAPEGGVNWYFSLNGPSPLIAGIDLFTKVGSQVDNGVKDVTVYFYSNETLLGQSSFTAARVNGWQSFSLSTQYAGVTNFTVNFKTSYGVSTAAEVNEIRLVTVPEPGTIAFAGIAGAVAVFLKARNRRRLNASK